MDHFQLVSHASNLAPTLNVASTFEPVLLHSAEMEKTQYQATCAVAYPAEQATAFAKLNLGKFDLSLHQHFLTGDQRAYGV